MRFNFQFVGLSVCLLLGSASLSFAQELVFQVVNGEGAVIFDEVVYTESERSNTLKTVSSISDPFWKNAILRRILKQDQFKGGSWNYQVFRGEDSKAEIPRVFAHQYPITPDITAIVWFYTQEK